MEFVVTEVERSINWLEWLKVNIQLLLFAILCDDCTSVDYKPIWWHLQCERAKQTPRLYVAVFQLNCNTQALSTADHDNWDLLWGKLSTLTTASSTAKKTANCILNVAVKSLLYREFMKTTHTDQESWRNWLKSDTHPNGSASISHHDSTLLAIRWGWPHQPWEYDVQCNLRRYYSAKDSAQKRWRENMVQALTHLVVQFEPLLCRCDGTQHRLSVDSTLDIWGCSQFISKHLLNSCHLKARLA